MGEEGKTPSGSGRAEATDKSSARNRLVALADKYDFCQIAGRSVPQFASAEWEFISCELLEINRHHANVLASYAITFRRRNQPEEVEQLIAKLYGKRATRAYSSYQIMHQLYEAGFGPPSQFRVPQPFGYSLKPGVLFVQKAPGYAWRELILKGPQELRSSSERAADWLLKLHGSDLSVGRGTHLMFLSRLKRLTRELVRLFPESAKKTEGLSRRIADAVPDYTVLKPSHGDFHARHLYMTPEITTGIDLDGVALREPEFDVGYAVGHLIMMSWFHSGSYDVGLKAADVFLGRYLNQGPIRLPRVRIHIALAILQSAHYGLVMLHPRASVNRKGLFEQWLELVGRYLETEGKESVLETKA